MSSGLSPIAHKRSFSRKAGCAGLYAVRASGYVEVIDDVSGVHAMPVPQVTRRVLLVDDHHVVVDALAAAFLATQMFARADKVHSLADALAALAADADCALLVLDLHLGDADGLNAVIVLRDAYPDIPVLIFSGETSAETVAAAFDCGVRGYVTKESPLEVVLGAVRVVLAGGCYIPPHVMRLLGVSAPLAAESGDGDAPPYLTPRQRQVLELLLQGMPNKVIGSRLEMAEGTVKTHLNTIYRVIGARNRAQAILRARALGMI